MHTSHMLHMIFTLSEHKLDHIGIDLSILDKIRSRKLDLTVRSNSIRLKQLDQKRTLRWIDPSALGGMKAIKLGPCVDLLAPSRIENGSVTNPGITNAGCRGIENGYVRLFD